MLANEHGAVAAVSHDGSVWPPLVVTPFGTLFVRDGVTGTMPAPALFAYVYAVTRALTAGSALSAATSCAAVVVRAPVLPVARLTTMSLVGTVTSAMPSLASVSFWSCSVHVPSVTVIDSGESFAIGFLNSAVMLLPPRWPAAFENS